MIIGISQLCIIPILSWGSSPCCLYLCFLSVSLDYNSIGWHRFYNIFRFGFQAMFLLFEGVFEMDFIKKIIIIINQNLCKTRNFYKIKADIEGYFSQKIKPDQLEITIVQNSSKSRSNPPSKIRRGFLTPSNEISQNFVVMYRCLCVVFAFLSILSFEPCFYYSKGCSKWISSK